MKSTVTGETPPQSFSLERQIRRGLDIHFRPEDEPSQRHPGDHHHIAKRRHPTHGGIGLGVEGLDNDFLDMAVAAVDIPNRHQGGDALGVVLTDAQEQATRKGNAKLPGFFMHADANRRVLVRRMKMGHPFAAQPLARGLHHETHGGVPRPKALHLLARKNARVGMGKHAARHGELAGLQHQVDGGAIAALGQPLAVAPVGDFGLIPQAHQGLGTARGHPTPDNLLDLFQGVGMGFGRIRQLGEAAIGTPVAAQVRQRQKNVPRDRDDIALETLLAREGPIRQGVEDAGNPDTGGEFEGHVGRHFPCIHRGVDQSLCGRPGEGSYVFGEVHGRSFVTGNSREGMILPGGGHASPPKGEGWPHGASLVLPGPRDPDPRRLEHPGQGLGLSDLDPHPVDAELREQSLGDPRSQGLHESVLPAARHPLHRLVDISVIQGLPDPVAATGFRQGATDLEVDPHRPAHFALRRGDAERGWNLKVLEQNRVALARPAARVSHSH